jgi:SAM-dependent methyltransferase
VASSLSSGVSKPDNFSFLQTNGRTFDLEDESVDVAYSNQLMEHLHVDDAQAQLQEILRVLKQGGRYVCVTPNRIGGPWDISMYFDKQATGFHMKEYTVGELRTMFQNLGCSAVNVYGGGKGIFFRLPVGFVCACEWLLQKFPDVISTPLARSLPGRAVLGIRIVAIK